MGSSPVTATIGPSAALLVETLEAFFDPPQRILVAFSGGPDSLALLAGLVALRERCGLSVEAAHFDHHLDAGSASRAAHARHLAQRLRVTCHLAQAPGVRQTDEPSRGAEADARDQRYAFLLRLAEDVGADVVATGHHADDQAETVCLRLLYGSGLAGLGAMRARSARGIVRPLLPLRRAQIVAALKELAAPDQLGPSQDPTNRDHRLRRNAIRHHLMPALAPGDHHRLLALAAAAQTATDHIRRVLGRELPLTPSDYGPSLPLDELRILPRPLVPWALALLHRAHGHRYPAPAGAARELTRLLERPGDQGFRTSAGGSLLWETHGDRLILRPQTDEPVGTSYHGAWPSRAGATFRMPLPTLDQTLVFESQPVAAWMRTGSPRRAALSPRIPTGRAFTVRTRRPGDRIRPLGSAHPKRLKDLLIDRKVPRLERDRLPLLFLEETLVWVPGVTINDQYRLRPEDRSAWVVRLEGAADREEF